MKVIAFDVSGIFWNAALGGAGKDDVEEPFRITCDTIRRMSDGYDRVVVAVDADRSFRQDRHPPYKAQRPERYAWQFEQLRRAIKWADEAGYHVFRADGFEADDVLMTVATWCAANNHHCSVVSNDKDMAAVLGCGPDVTLWRRNGRGGTGDDGARWTEWTAERFQEAQRFPPHRVPEFLALAGDASDGFKFFPGVAEETARKLLQAYPNLEAVWTAATQASEAQPFAVKVPTRVLEALRANWVNVYLLALEIATPRADVPIDVANIESERPVTLGDNSIQAPQSQREPDDVDGEAGAARTNAAAQEAPVTVERAARRTASAMALATRDDRYELAPYEMQPHTIDDAWRLATMAIRAGILPQFARPEQAAMVIMAGRERGISAFTALQNTYVVKGKLGWAAAVLASMVLQDPTCEYFEIVESTATCAVLASKQRGRPERRLKYTIEEARQAGLVTRDSQWEKRPATMLRWAAFREAARAFWPHRTTGVYTPAEIRERFDAADAEAETAGEVIGDSGQA